MKRPRLRRWLKILVLLSTGTAALTVILLSVAWALFPFPESRLRSWPRSVEVTERAGSLLQARISHEEQWRRPVQLACMSPWLVRAVIAVEDERFRIHPGVDPLAVARATCQNLAAWRVVSGASTITMQVCRMLEPRPRTFRSKGIEAFRALQLEALLSKDEILETYLNIAPYGGNLRGVEAAARRYFSRSCSDLSLAEAALLAGLPQSPERLRPDRHPQRARHRQRVVLRRMETPRLVLRRFAW